MEQKVTLDDVARLSGVSRSAASRALNDRPGVRSDVRERVNRIADHLGFRPNRAAKNLASGRSSVIGLVIPSDDLRVDPYGAAMTHAVGRAASQLDLGMMLHLAAEEPGDTVNHILRDGLIDGLLISSVAADKQWVDELFDSVLPTVLIGTHPTRDDVLSVDVENTESAAGAVTHLFEQGCERVGCIAGPLDRADARARLDGYRLAHDRAGRPVDEALIAHGRFSRASGLPAGAELFEKGVDGIFASNDEMAVGAILSGARSGFRVPDDVLVVGFDGTAFDEVIEPTITSVIQPFDEIGRTAVELLNKLVHGEAGLTSVSIVPPLVQGGSTTRP
ncbi:LacI family transcriptional regulator [Ilumatobacter fluminis]|uniref:LacI family transcriptional regulator n=1 Tax=Ilumatobacter fluminis TaxID=467091 RepID=A0A4R7I284_9ACTN|nr:LacI family DNA-binding transcriptional regulator [Ilumatobacter fluminis]TDT17565.1 LacI family transcriptional regulator [Ilumatobacter fluminis]